MPIEIRPLSAALGAEVVGVDLSRPLDDNTFARIHEAHLEHLVLAIRDQDLTPEQHIAFSRRFGELDIHVLDQFLLPGHPEILVVSNKKVDGRAVGLQDAGNYWHSDISYREFPSLGSLLYALEIPPEGGDTLFANMYAAYETLPEETKARIDGLEAVHGYGQIYKLSDEEGGSARQPLSEEQKAKIPDVVHPVVRTHPETGGKALYVSPGLTVAIAGMDDDESRTLLAELHEHSTKPQFVYQHRWRRHDVLFWDNRCTMHLATGYDPQFTRHMHRTTVKGDRPVRP